LQSQLYAFSPLVHYFYAVPASGALLPSLRHIFHSPSSCCVRSQQIFELILTKSNSFTYTRIFMLRAWKVYALREQSLHRTADGFQKVVQDPSPCLTHCSLFVVIRIMCQSIAIYYPATLQKICYGNGLHLSTSNYITSHCSVQHLSMPSFVAL
jgi:hypothetical protein